MASLIKGRIKQSPSGLCSVIFSHVPSGSAGFKPCRVYRGVFWLCIAADIYLWGCAFQIENAGGLNSPLTWQSFQSSAKSGAAKNLDSNESGLIAGKGGLGRKKKMSWKSSVNLRERMAATELEYGRENSWFLTLTQPSTDARAYEALARYSSYAIDRLNREFNRCFQGQKFSRCSVWEYQDRGSLHCHILISSDCIHAMNIEEFRLHICKVWHRILAAISSRFESQPFLSSFGKNWSLEELSTLKNEKGKYIFVDCQQVRKSIVAYLSSYLSGSNHEEKGQSKNDKRENFFPIATWCQWNKRATELFDKYSDSFDLGECEPDRKRDLIRIKESLHFDILKKIPLARNTEVKEPQNPYNEGLYFIPAKPQNSSLARLLVGYIEKLQHIFKPSKEQSEIKEYPPILLKDLIEYDSELAELAIREYERNQREGSRIFAGNYGRNIGNLGTLMLELMQGINDFSIPFIPIQLELNYGL